MRRKLAGANRGSQSGQSLVEAVVASALLGVVVVVGLTTLNTATFGARQAVHHAWADCVGRAGMEAVLAAGWIDGGAGTAYAAPAGVSAVVDAAPIGSGIQAVQRIHVRVTDESGLVLFDASVYKSRLLSPTGSGPFSAADVTASCPPPSGVGGS